MVWGAFHASGKSELVVVDGTVNQQRYIGILRQNLLLWASATFQKKIVLVHDNATPQIARNTRNFLAGEEVDVMQRPAQRPYLNIFGTRWGCLSEIWINLLPQWLGYGRPSCKLGAQCPLKGLRSLYEACLDDWGPWWPRGEVIPDITRKLKDPINYNIPWNISFKWSPIDYLKQLNRQ